MSPSNSRLRSSWPGVGTSAISSVCAVESISVARSRALVIWRSKPYRAVRNHVVLFAAGYSESPMGFALRFCPDEERVVFRLHDDLRRRLPDEIEQLGPGFPRIAT